MGVDGNVTNEQKQKYLLSYGQYKQREKRLQEQLNELRLGKMSPGLILSDMPSAHSQKDLSDYMVKYDDLANRIIKARKQAIERYSEVQQQIEQSVYENEAERDILIYRYVMGDTWEKVCEKLGYSYTNVHRIHRKAIEHFSPACI